MNGRQSAARAHRRAMKKAGVEVAVREFVDGDGSPYSYSSRLRGAVGVAMLRLETEGADMTSRIAITIGNDHPNFPGKTIVEAKAAASVKPSAAGDLSRTLPVYDPDRDDAGQ